jgi:cob(I)alamin adenosyltransferase
MKIYTKTGDTGTTGLYDGSRVQKNDQILDVLGSLDELSAHIGSLLYALKISNVMSEHIIVQTRRCSSSPPDASQTRDFGRA